MTRGRFFGVALGLAVVASAGVVMGQGSGPMMVDIARLAPSLEPEFALWRTGEGDPGEWTVIADATAAGGRVLAQISKDKTGYRFPLAIYKPFSGKDLDVSVRFKAVGGTVDQAGGIAVRLLTPDDYYVLRANALEDNVRFYRVVKGRREQLAGADIKVIGNAWHTLALRAEGEHFRISFDGKPLFAAQDGTFANPGKVALWTKADSVTYFDSLAIRPLPDREN
jgi:hypothetical protein